MLILTRRIGEAIIISEKITIINLGINGNQVRIGIEAPADVSVHREEIHQKILNERSIADMFLEATNDI